MTKKLVLAIITIMLFQGKIQSQKWTQMLNDTNANYYDIVKEFENYWKDRPYEKGKGYKAFKRWQWFTEPRVYPTGNMKLASRGYAYEQYQNFLKNNPHQRLSQAQAASSSTTANWTALGPFGSPVGGDAGRLQVIRVHPTNPNMIYVGAAAGGFWMSNNGGVSYTTTTNQLASLGVSDIAINLINPSIIYISTGDKDAGDTHSTGVLKSIDGGLTWTQTGLLWTTSQQRRIYRLLINPLNPNTLIAATSVGIYRSLNAGQTWSLVQNGFFVDAEYRPNDTTTVYAVDNGYLYRSTNGGNTFNSVSFTVNPTFSRLSLAVTPANNNYVYVLASANNNGFGGLYRSTNSGTNFSLMSSTPNIFDWSTNGSGIGGQGWYDIAIDASPTNANEIVAGGVNSWKSTNGGANWTLNTHWTGSGGRPYVHADLHCVYYTTGSTIYLGTDGGIARSTNNGSTYQTINGNMNIAQIYRLGLSASNPARIITGHQDNGSNLSNGTSWSSIYGGDGMDCFIDWNNNNILVASTQNGGFTRSTNGGSGWSSIISGLTGNAPWLSPIVQDPNSSNTYYCGYQKVYKITFPAFTWTPISNFNASMDEIKVSPLNSNTIIASSSGTIWRTTNGGTTWSIITGAVAGAGAQITDICMDNQNPNNIFATVSGYVNGNKVYKTNDGGITWINYSTGLPNIPVNCIVYANNSAQGVYIGTDVGVYYREASMSSWIPFFNGLPNVIVSDLEIYYPTGKLRAATYGRGVWETEVYSSPTAVPFGGHYTNFSSACVNVPLTVFDASSNNPTTWNWTFAGGSPSTSNQQNPIITFSATGIYTFSLIAGNANGLSSPYIGTISVVSNPTFVASTFSICINQNVQLFLNTNANNVSWSTGQQGISVNVSPSVTSIYNFTASLGACLSTGNTTVFVSSSIPQTPTVILVGSFLTTTTNANSFQWYLNGSAIPNATAQTILPTQAGYYSVLAANDGCKSSSDSYLFETNSNTANISDINQIFSSIEILPNPVKDELIIKYIMIFTSDLSIQIIDGIGKTVYESNLKSNENINEQRLNMQFLSSGVYFLNLKNQNGSAQIKFIKQ
jgi:photosystem II stability/assembly factor-like uncharacterized protein